MKRIERILEVLTPKRWPVRWRLAAVSAVLTFLILVAFALVVGRLTQNRLEGNFDDELRDATNQLAQQGAISNDSGFGGMLGDAAGYRLLYAEGTVIEDGGHSDFGPPSEVSPGFSDAGPLRVYTVQVAVNRFPAFLQYARSTDNLDSTIARLWLFLGLGILGGTALAALAGIAIAGRAMRPIATLTSTARTIAATRDPSQRIPDPQRDDEVGELARTLDQMLRELDAARSETEQTMQRQREFVADASHELRTPLTSVLANLELLQDRLASDASTDEEQEIVGSALRCKMSEATSNRA